MGQRPRSQFDLTYPAESYSSSSNRNKSWHANSYTRLRSWRHGLHLRWWTAQRIPAQTVQKTGPIPTRLRWMIDLSTANTKISTPSVGSSHWGHDGCHLTASVHATTGWSGVNTSGPPSNRNTIHLGPWWILLTRWLVVSSNPWQSYWSTCSRRHTSRRP